MRPLLYLQYPLINHLGAVCESPALRGLSLALVVAGIVEPYKSVRRLLLFVALASVIAYFALSDIQLGWVYLLIPSIVPLVLLAVFGATLLPNQEPLVTRIGELARGPLSQEMRLYTRRVTILWTALFIFYCAETMLLAYRQLSGVGTPVEASWWLNIFNPVSVGLVFVGEYIYRKWRFPDHAHPNFRDYVQIVMSSR